ncbi:MAG: hypothetical protein COW03_13895 [Cytophagales bacterium CG12_big_fil_rev_8_21_14_0_65_40_12]|nr:MAG: hypothetical protein COW03_13895 [Cytophagales bacterium CG12_big_fil_rev_8_21_14_0_65_40_12]PIW04216.1 MAG: hypothetical protein COW40_10820 [Cytophagales bacterium CG17_big_fil_post_rev_8_21_14_2_50_40_13]
MSLTVEQIAAIKAFINKRGFNTIEVEMEILDHVASAVEAKLEADPKKALEKAIQEVHAGFGVFGFATIEEEKAKYFHTIIRKQLWKELKNYFVGRKIWITLLTLFTLSLSTKWFLSNEIYLRTFPFAAGIVLVIYAYLTNYLKYRKWRNRSLMLSVAGLPLLVLQPNLGNFIGIISEEVAASNTLLASGLYVGLFLLMIIATLAIKDTMTWAFHWTNERYLKYA